LRCKYNKVFWKTQKKSEELISHFLHCLFKVHSYDYCLEKAFYEWKEISSFTPILPILKAKIRLKICKYFSRTHLSHNYLSINALQNLLFCIPKAALLHGKSVVFAAQNSHFRNAKAQLSLFKKVIFTKPKKNLIFANTI
jgi:hypothetical protein